jgi:hypothetical protein
MSAEAELRAAQWEAVEEIAETAMEALGAALARHGRDPENDAILALGLVAVIRSLDQVLPGFASVVAASLAAPLAPSEAKRP